MRPFVLAAASLAALAAPDTARACAACACGDPTLTVMGAGKPFDGRVRLAAELRHRTDAIGTARVDGLELDERSLSIMAAFTPWRRATLAARLPWVHRRTTGVSGAVDTVNGPGDLELRGRITLWEDRPLASRHLLSLSAGGSLPTSPTVTDDQGAALPSEAQPGMGALTPMVGLSYGSFRPPWSGYLGVSAWFPGQNDLGVRSGRSIRGSLAGQWQPSPTTGLRLGANARWDEVATVRGEAEADSGGWIAFLAPEVLWTPTQDLVLSLAVRVPLADGLLGEHEEGPVTSLSATWDL